ncbi:hypothetical protein R3P38DRAFT_2926062 [Favolaschia claudopus]|uniref:Uncharacterized protein n=1 Tax=Favolaschia claudopus TaxID=2862362 RepID=A0AAW0BYQ7_9AGAR
MSILMHNPRNTPSFLRRSNPRVLFAALFLSCVGYYAGRLSTFSTEGTSEYEVRRIWSTRTLPELERVTVTVDGPQVTVLGPQVTFQAPQATVTVTTEVFVPKADIPEDAPIVLNGPPTEALQDNLRDDVQYITSFPGTGFTNDVMAFMNLLYLAILTQRVPIMPFFTPTHVTTAARKTVPPIDFGVIFDIPRLSKELGMPVLEWWQVKDRSSKTIDPLGCWSIWKAVSTRNKDAHPSSAPNTLHLDISWTTPPTWIKLLKDLPEEPHARFTSLMALTFPDLRGKSLRPSTPSPRLKLSLPPDERLVCFDNMYWIANVEPHELTHDYSTTWRFVGKNLHWNPRIEGLARDYIRQTFSLPDSEPIPPYITIHVRHNDFASWCKLPVDECFAPLSAFARRVEEVKDELRTTKGISVERVIVTSDEKNSTFWDEVASFDWYRVDHHKTVDTYGGWYPILIDAAIQSGGMGLVGTDLSTVSMIAAHRVKAWQGGASRMVKWGRPGADDH